MLNKFVLKNFKYTSLFSKTNLFASIYNINIKSFAKKEKGKDKGRLSDSESKRGAKATSETMSFTETSNSSDAPSTPSAPSSYSLSPSKQIQTVENHKVSNLFYY
jgi:hypothetical protein